MPLKPIKLPPQEDLLAKFRYDPETGKLYRKYKGGREKETGAPNNVGYPQAIFNGRKYLVTRIIWKMVTGEDPDYIDHENHDKTDNRWANLRSVTHQDNMKNKSLNADNTSGVFGVRWNKASKKWVATIGVNGKPKHLGIYDNIEDAIAARVAAEKKYGFHKNHGAEREAGNA